MNFFTSLGKKSTFILAAALLVTTAASALTAVTGEKETPATVMYQSIKVSVTEKSVILDWNTVSESGNSYFEVERSTNMTDFKTVALVLDGFTTEGTGKKYAFKEDITVAKNGRSVYYRLKKFDEYGNVSYSAIVKAL